MKSRPVIWGLYNKPIFSDSYEPSSSCHVKVFVVVAAVFLGGIYLEQRWRAQFSLPMVEGD